MAPHIQKARNTQRKRAEQRTELNKAIERKKTKKEHIDTGTITDEERKNDIKQNTKRKTKGLNSITNKLDYKSKSGADAGKTNEHMMRLSEYSAHGSNWANELARTLKEEIAKSAKTLVTYIDPSYTAKTKGGRETTEKEFLTDTIKKVKNELSSYIAQLEAGSEEVTLDMLKETSAVIKILTKAMGKTTEQAEKTIVQAIQGRYDQKQSSSKGGGKLGGTGLEEGQEKGVGIGHENTQKLVSKLYEAMKQWDSEVVADTIAKEMVLGTEKVLNKIENKRKNSTKGSQSTKAITDLKSSEVYKNELDKLNGATDKTFAEMRKGTKATQAQTRLDRIENVREAVADSKEQNIQTVNRDINKDTAGTVKNDADTGFNTTSKADELIHAVEKEDEIKLPDDITDILKAILTQITVITTITKSKEPRHYKVSRRTGTKTSNEDRSFEMKAAYAELGKTFEPIKNALVPVLNSVKKSVEIPKAVSKSDFDKIVPKILKKAEQPEGKVQKSNIYASPIKHTIWDKLEDGLNRLTGATKEYEEVINAAADEQDRFAAERITKYGLNNGRNPNDTGDIASIRRALELFRTNKRSIEDNKELSQKIQLTKGVEVDTTKITKALNDTLSGKQMRIAQMGGSIPRQILGGLTGFVGMPSLEKSRAQADGLNQILGNINKALNSVLSSIQMKETELKGLEEAGKAKFDDKGNMIEGTSSARKTFVDLEEYKLVLSSILADMETIDTVVDSTNGKFSKLVKRLNFTSPVLRENNDILRNINAGLDKGGKALKFQTRWAEILNYTFQLMSRSVGQMLKNAISKIGSLLNPINWIKNAAGTIKNLFSDFGSYDTKWQRTMNVIKINFQRLIKPAMEWIAQKIVNIIGYLDVASQAFQRVFGKIPISLFDQAGADAEKIHREMEEAANVTLGFDELHDIGTDNSGANDLLGDIYKPQLDPKWVEQFDKLGEVLGKFFKGDLGFGEVCKQILNMLGMLLGDIGKAIWEWFKNTAIGKYITEHWKGILATILAIFLGWKLLKIAGSALFNALFGKLLNGGAISGIFGKIGGWLSSGFSTIFSKGGIVGAFKAGGSSLGGAFAGTFLSVVGIALGAITLKDAENKAQDVGKYNYGVELAGGGKNDEKSNWGNIGQGALGGAVMGGSIGAFAGPVGIAVGAAIGAIAGAIDAALQPAFGRLEEAAKKANNEMMSIETYEGMVQANKTKVDEFTELLNLSNQTLQEQTTKVYDLGEKYGVSKSKLDTLVEAMKNGNYNSEMAVGLNEELVTALGQLDYHYQNNASLTDKLTEAKKKLQKAELELAIANDIEAGNFEMAAARIEYAMSAGLYEVDEAAKKMSQIMKETSLIEGQELLKNVSPELQKKYNEYTLTTEQGMADLAQRFKDSNKSERNYILENMEPELRSKFLSYLGTTEKWRNEYIKYYKEANDEVKKAFDDPSVTQQAEKAGEKNAQALFNGLKRANVGNKIIAWFKDLIPGGETGSDYYKRKGIASYDVGTMYVPNDGLAMIHKGEAIIPADDNVWAKQGQAWQNQGMMNDQMLNAITRLEQTIAQGINVKGEFRQRGSDLVATVEKNKNRQSNNVLNNKVFAR